MLNGGYTLRSVAVPGNLAGSAGDTVGDIASNESYLYYCTVSSTQTNYIGYTYGGATGPKYVNMVKSTYGGPSAPVAGMIVTLRSVAHTITSVTDQSTYWQLNYSASETGSDWGPGETVTITTEPAVGNIWKTVPWDAITSATFNTGTLVTTAVTAQGLTAGVTLTAVANAGTTSTTAAGLGYIGMPQNSTATSYTLVAGDQGKHIYVTATGQTITVPSNATTPFPVGTTVAVIAGPSATTSTIAITSDTMYLGGTGSTGTRTLAAYGMATLVKVAETTWFINGTGLT